MYRPRLPYGIARRRYLSRLRGRTGRPIVVLTPGKTGSNAVERVIESAAPDRPMYKVHRISEPTVEAAELRYREHSPRRRPRHIWAAQHLREQLPTPTSPWDVVTPLREPVGRGVAAYFQTSRRLRHEIDDPARALDGLLSWPQFWASPAWVDEELRAGLGIDVYGSPFNHGVGYSIIENSATRLLLVRFESLSNVHVPLGEMLGCRVSPPSRANVGEEKGYAMAYKRFKAEVAIPESVLDELYGSKFARHFWTDDELDSYRQDWSRGAQ